MRSLLRLFEKAAAPWVALSASSMAVETPTSGLVTVHAWLQAEKAGAAVRMLKLAEVFAEAFEAQHIVQDFEAHDALAWEYATHHDEIAPKLRAGMDKTVDLSPSAHSEALAVANRARHRPRPWLLQPHPGGRGRRGDARH